MKSSLNKKLIEFEGSPKERGLLHGNKRYKIRDASNKGVGRLILGINNLNELGLDGITDINSLSSLFKPNPSCRRFMNIHRKNYRLPSLGMPTPN